MKYIDAEKLIAEIERFSATEYDGNTLGDDIANGALDFVIEEIIPSLQQEQPEVDLEKEIDLCWQDWISPSNQSSVEGVLPKSEFSMYARHFYELGLNARKEE